MELTVDRVSKQYGSKIAVDRISLKLQAGIYGLLGENGAGKTTLMRLLCGILKPTSGSITLDGMDVSQEEYRADLGYLPQDFGYYPEFTGEEFLLYMAAWKGLNRVQARRKSAELLEAVTGRKAKIMISGYDCELYDFYLGNWKKVQVAARAQNKKQRGETLWMNYDLEAEQIALQF